MDTVNEYWNLQLRLEDINSEIAKYEKKIAELKNERLECMSKLSELLNQPVDQDGNING